MPRKTDLIKIADPFMDRRTKLLPCQREMVHHWYGLDHSINSIAKMFRVNKRLIQFELFPERKKRNIELRQERGSYYNKSKNTVAMREHRDYKKELFKKDEKP